MLLYTGVGTASVVILIVLIGLALLILIKFRKRGETYCNLLFRTCNVVVICCRTWCNPNTIFWSLQEISSCLKSQHWETERIQHLSFDFLPLIFAANHLKYCHLMLAIIIILLLNQYINIHFSWTPSSFLLNPKMMHYNHNEMYMYSVCIIPYSYISFSTTNNSKI